MDDDEVAHLSALNLGSLSVLVELPLHAFSSAKREGKQFFHTPDNSVHARQICHEATMRFLVETGWRVRWGKAASA